MEHSKENWRVGYGDADNLLIEAYFPYDNAWWAIARIELDEHGAYPTEEQERDAHLMASAPELLKELEKMVANCECFGTGISYTGKVCQVCWNAKNAILKAKYVKE